jgi:arylsulfatase A-like enzyme
VAEGAAKHPILEGVEVDKLQGFGSLYKVSPLADSATPLLLGSLPDKPIEPVAWVNRSRYGGRVFYTALADPQDFCQPAQNRLLANAIHWAAGLPVPAAAPPSQTVRAVGRPNIVFIMADDLGYAHLGCYGQQRIRTPNIDRLAAQGARFTQVYAGCNVCAPCRSVLMTGLHMGHTPVRGNSGGISMRDEDVTVAEVLKQAGYATGGYGKWGLGDAGTPGVAYRQGFDEFFGYYDQVHAHSFYPPYLWQNDRKYLLPGNSGRESDGLTGEKRGQYSHDEILTKALDFIRRHKDQPFFCYVPSTIPHFELLVPGDSLREYAGKWPEPTPFVSEQKHYCDQLQPRAALAAMVSRLDREVGRIMALLDELWIADNTVVFFTSDNGAPGGGGSDPDFFQANGPLSGYKGMMYEGGLRVPMIVRWPGRVPAGSVNEHVWYFADVMPTLAELAGAAPPKNIDGISVVPTLLGKPGQRRHDYLYWEASGFDPKTGAIRRKTLAQAVRMGDWKAIRQRGNAAVELYDLSSDLGETTDVAERHRQIVAKIEAIMAAARVDPPPQLEPQSPPNRAFR